jgi:uncharacterized protein (DUF58 family)
VKAPFDINFARLNHILLPDTKAGRDRFRRGVWGKVFSPLTWLYDALTEEGRVLLVASVLVGFFGLDVQGTEVFLLWAAIAGVLAASLAVRRAYGLAGVSVSVLAPRRVTIGEEMRFTVALRNDGARDAFAVRVRGPFLPWDGQWAGRAKGVRRLAAGTEERVEIAARFSARGEHHLDAFGAAALVPFGLASGRAVWSRGVKFLVLPRIANVTRITTALGRRHQPGGIALASRTGESMDLLGVRPYRPGDPVKHLHAKSWARAGVPVVREYQEEYFSRVGVIVDTAAASERVLEAAVSLAAGVVARLSRGEALIDLLVVGGELHDLTIGRHLGFLEQALDLLACVEAAKARVPAAELLARVAPHLSRLSCVIVVTGARGGASASRELVEGLRGFGAGVTTLVVEGDERAGAAGRDAGAGVTVIAADAIERGEALSL